MEDEDCSIGGVEEDPAHETQEDVAPGEAKDPRRSV